MKQMTVSNMQVYPIKSTQGIAMSTAFVESRGLAFDRRFVLIDGHGKAITARTQSILTQVKVTLTAGGLHLIAPKMKVLKVIYAEFSSEYLSTQVWSSNINGQHCHLDYDAWFSELLGFQCQLVFFGEASSRLIKNSTQEVGFADGYPLLLISEASLADLNSKSEHQHEMSQFRPNLVVKNTAAFAEDSWQKIRIGDVEFLVDSPCSRCVFTTINPKTGEKDKNGEPLSVLQQYRKGTDGNLYFGQNLIPLNEGFISLEDEVEVLETKSPEQYPDFSAAKTMVNQVNDCWVAGVSQRLTCIGVQSETKDVKTFIFKLPVGIKTNYLAGQFLTLNLMINGKQVNRSYTLSSSPSRADTLSITVKKILGGEVSNFLHQTMQPGETVMAQAPAGIFHHNLITQEQVLLLSAGSGITPMLSILKYLADNQINKKITFLHSAHTQSDLIAKQEIQLLAKQQKNTQVIYTLTKESPPDWRGYQGRITQEMLANVPNLTECSILVCGPAEFMTTAKALLLSLGVDEANYHQESFGFDLALAVKIPDREMKSCNILFDSWDNYYQGDNQLTVLEQAEAAGVDIPYSCRSGFCGTCKIKLESGEVDMKEDSGLSPDDKDAGYILSCSCVPLSDLVITQG